MTDDKSASDTPATPLPGSDANDTPLSRSRWVGVGIGSAALVAALMYATKRRVRK